MRSRASNRKTLALARISADLLRHVVRIGSSGTFLLAEMKPPFFDPDLLRLGGQQVLDHRLACGVSLNMPNRSPPPVTPRVGRVDVGEGEEVVVGRALRPPRV